MPLSLTGPPGDRRISPGKTLDRVGMHADITPTVLDLLGLWKPEKIAPSRPQERSAEDLLDELRQKQERKSALQAGGGGDDSPPPSGQRVRGGGDDDASREGAAKRASPPPPGSGLVGDSLLGPDYRGCAISATHYGAKTLAVVAGDWKGLFLYRWEKRGDVTHAEVREKNECMQFASPTVCYCVLSRVVLGCTATYGYLLLLLFWFVWRSWKVR